MLRVQPICRSLLVAPVQLSWVVADGTDVSHLRAGEGNNIALRFKVRLKSNANFPVYGLRKVWDKCRENASKSLGLRS